MLIILEFFVEIIFVRTLEILFQVGHSQTLFDIRQS